MKFMVLDDDSTDFMYITEMECDLELKPVGEYCADLFRKGFLKTFSACEAVSRFQSDLKCICLAFDDERAAYALCYVVTGSYKKGFAWVLLGGGAYA